MEFLSVNNIAFTVWRYPVSWVELLGTVFNLWCVYLVSKGKILNWPVGIVGVSLFAILFYQIQLYSDLLEQFYYFVTGFLGWWMWSKAKRETGRGLRVRKNTRKENLIYGGVIVVGVILLTMVVKRLDRWFPQIFVLAASYPFWDALTTVMSFAAQWLMAKRRLENWILWILVDVIGVVLYFSKGVMFVSILYAIFLVLATRGLFNWLKIWKEQE